MNQPTLTRRRVRELLRRAATTRSLVVGDVMLDHFIWGKVSRISPEAPVPVVEFRDESFMPGGAANVARNLTSLGMAAEMLGTVGKDGAARRLRQLFREQRIGCEGLIATARQPTSVKTRIVAHQQQVVRIDRENCDALSRPHSRKLLAQIRARLASADAVVVGDYGKGVVTQWLLDQLKLLCRDRGVWLSLDPKPVHRLHLSGLSLITPNRKEAFELAGLADNSPHENPLEDKPLLQTANVLLEQLSPALLLVTLGEQGMLLCQKQHAPLYIPTIAQEVFDVSGAGDTVIATFTMAIAAGASPSEAAVLSNHAAGIVVGKMGTATVTPDELLSSFATS